MVTLTQSNSPTAASAARANQIRNSMSVANLITAPTPATLEDTTAHIIAAPPSSPAQAIASTGEHVDSPDITMSDLTEANTGAHSAQASEPLDVMTADAEVKEESDHKDGSSDITDGKRTYPQSTITTNQVVGDAADDAEDVPDTEREFICMNDPCGRCMTGQYTKDLSRKVISDHFGRNKACTRDIVDWPLFCRKHYQRATYNKPRWQVRKIELILRQFDLIENQFPGTTYDIHFKKSEEARLNQYSRLVANGTPHADAEQSVLPVAGKHFEAPIDVLRELDQLLSKDKSYEEVRKVVGLISEMLEQGDTEQVPSVEFLPKIPGKAKKSPSKARVSKSPRTPKRSKTPKSPGTPSRVSAKGSVKKTSNKA
ncbi:hypothetical protein J1614_010087 [Plenodomus biglobosus]|nr:hypothetical protein J1614_010087 [Plenodomus biglobosus]